MSTTPVPGAEQLYEAAPCGHLVAGPDGTLLHANGTFCRWLRMERPELVGATRLTDLLTAGGRIFFHTHLQPLLRMQGSVSEVKLEVRRRDGQLLPMIFNIAEQAWEGAMLLHVAAFAAEDRHQYEKELLLQRQRAEELARQVARSREEVAAARAEAEDRAQFAEQLVGVVSHDMRNPLSVIQMSATFLQRRAGAEYQPAVARIDRAAGRMQHLIGDLLDFTQARLGGGIQVRPVKVDLHQVVADAVAELGEAFTGRALWHEAVGDGECEADPQRVVQAVGNLVGNAMNHGARDRPVTVRTYAQDAFVGISIHNEGEPIPPELVPTLFDAMVRGDAAEPRKGVGLGLYIVREIVRGHGGRVGVESSPAEGTTFRLELPRIAAPRG